MDRQTEDKLLLSCILPAEASRTRLKILLGESGSSIDWRAIARRADFHQISSLLRYNLSQIGALESIPLDVSAELTESSRIWAARHLAYVDETSRLIQTLKSEGIEALPLKGAALMLGGYYPRAGLRTATDIDLILDPSQIERAEKKVESLGYLEIEGRRMIRARQRLPNELNHLWPRRGPGGLLLELHHRAFHFSRRERDLSFAEIRDRAVAQSRSLSLPSAADLSLHLIHHTMVDLQSAHLLLRTFADLYFIFTEKPEARETLDALANDLGFDRIVKVAHRALHLLSNGSIEDLADAKRDKDLSLLLDTALMESTEGLAGASRIFDYLDFSHSPVERAGNLLSLIFTPRAHLEQIYGRPKSGGMIFQYLRRPFDMIGRLRRQGLSPASLLRARKLRKIAKNARKSSV